MNIEFKSEVEHLVKTKLHNNKSIVLYGSSSLRLWGTLHDDFSNLKMLNLAFGGSTIEDCVGYYNELLEQTNPELIVFYGGDNDLGQGASPEQVTERFETLLSSIEQDFGAIPFVFISIKPSPQRVALLPKIKQTNERIGNIVSNKENCFYIDVFSKMMLSETEIDTTLFVEDNLHMNGKGYSIWQKELSSFLEKHKQGK